MALRARDLQRDCAGAAFLPDHLPGKCLNICYLKIIDLTADVILSFASCSYSSHQTPSFTIL